MADLHDHVSLVSPANMITSSASGTLPPQMYF